MPAAGILPRPYDRNLGFAYGHVRFDVQRKLSPDRFDRDGEHHWFDIHRNDRRHRKRRSDVERDDGSFFVDIVVCHDLKRQFFEHRGVVVTNLGIFASITIAASTLVLGGCYGKWDLPVSRAQAISVSSPNSDNHAAAKTLGISAGATSADPAQTEFQYAKNHCYYLDAHRGRWNVAAAILGSLAGTSGVSAVAAAISGTADATPSGMSQPSVSSGDGRRAAAISLAIVSVVVGAATAGSVVAANGYDKDYSTEKCTELLGNVPTAMPAPEASASAPAPPVSAAPPALPPGGH